MKTYTELTNPAYFSHAISNISALFRPFLHPKAHFLLLNHDPPDKIRDIVHIATTAMKDLSYSLRSSEQLFQQEKLVTVGEKPATEFHLLFSPSRIVDNAIGLEKKTTRMPNCTNRLTLTAFQKMKL